MKKQILAVTAMVLLTPAVALSQTWEDKADFPGTARNHPANFSLNGIGYLATGWGTSDLTDDFYSYDPDKDEWTQKTNFPGVARGFGYAVNSDTKGYLGFGRAPGAGGDIALNDLWEYDPSTDQWKELASLPAAARWHPAMVYVDGKIFVGCGSSFSGNLKDWWEYDIASDSWIRKADLPGPARHHPYYFGLDGFAYVGMGHGATQPNGKRIFKDFYKYDPANDSWEQVSDLPAEGRVAGTQFALNGKGYVLSGQGENHLDLKTGEFWEYDPISDEWTELNPHTGGGRWAPGSFVVDDWVYFMCGRIGSTDQNDMMAARIVDVSSTDEINTSTEVVAYPNPSKGDLRFMNIGLNANVKIMDLSGKVVYETSLDENQILNLSELSNGTYLFDVTTTAGNSRGRVLLN